MDTEEKPTSADLSLDQQSSTTEPDFTTGVVKSAIREHYDPIASVDETLRVGVFEPAGIEVPRFSIRIADGEHYTHGGRYAQAKDYNKVGKVIPIPEALFASRSDVAMAMAIGAINLKLGNKGGYLNRDVVELLRKIGIDTKQGNKYGAGRNAIPYVVEGGLLARWIDSNPALDEIPLIKAKPPAMPRNRRVSAEKVRRKPIDPQTERRLRQALESANHDYNTAVSRAEELQQQAARAEQRAEAAHDLVVELQKRVTELEAANAQLMLEREELRHQLADAKTRAALVIAEKETHGVIADTNAEEQPAKRKRARKVDPSKQPTAE